MKRAALVQQVLASCYCRLQPSPIAGIGVFAIRPIRRGLNPFRVIGRYANPGHMHVTEDEIAKLPAGLAALIRSLFLPSEGKLIIPTCGTNLVNLACYLNHSPQPNIHTRDGCAFIALRKIRSGEELTVDYRTYSAEGVLPANVMRPAEDRTHNSLPKHGRTRRGRHLS